MRQRQFLWGRWLLRTLLAEITGLTPAELRFKLQPNGRPFLADWPQVQFSLSHADTQVWAAVGSGALGVDVERVRPERAVMALARRYFSPEEYAALQCLHPKAQATQFYVLWTRKEALAKASGAGLSATLQVAVLQDSLAWREAQWQFHRLTAPNNLYIASLVSVDAPAEMRMLTDWHISTEPPHS